MEIFLNQFQHRFLIILNLTTQSPVFISTKFGNYPVNHSRTENIIFLESGTLLLQTIGGIIIPDTAKEKPLKGEVIAVGNGTKDEEMVLKVGDTVLYGKYAGTELEVEGTKYLIMRQSDVLAVLG